MCTSGRARPNAGTGPDSGVPSDYLGPGRDGGKRQLPAAADPTQQMLPTDPLSSVAVPRFPDIPEGNPGNYYTTPRSQPVTEVNIAPSAGRSLNQLDPAAQTALTTAQAEDAKRRRMFGFMKSFNTSPLGVPGKPITTGKTLLGQ